MSLSANFYNRSGIILEMTLCDKSLATLAFPPDKLS